MKKKLIVGLIILVVVGGVGGYFWFFNQETVSKFETVKAEKKDLIQTVEETGKIKAKQEIKLSFDRAGTLEKNLVKVGEQVEKGDKLAELDYDTLVIQEKEAQAGLKAARAKLRKLQAGGSPADVNVSESRLQQARENYQSALADLEETKKTVSSSIEQARDHLHNLKDDGPDTVTSYEQAIKSARENLDDTKETYRQQINKNKELSLSTANSCISTVNTALDEIDNIINDDDLRDMGVLGAKNSSFLTKTEDYYKKSEQLRQKVNKVYDRAKTEDSWENTKDLLVTTLDLLDKTSTALDNCFQMLQKSITSSGFTSAQLNTFKATISQQTSNVNTAVNSAQTIKNSLESSYNTYKAQVTVAKNKLQEAETKLDDAIRNAEDSLETATTIGDKKITAAKSKVQTVKQALEVAKSQLNQAESPARREDIALARAKIEQASSSLSLIKEKIKNSIITAPMDGQITKVNFEIGEQVSPQSPAIQIISGKGLKIEVNISEVDITKVETGDEVTVTLDAFGEDRKFHGRVESIDPAETVIQDVVYYEVTINLTDNKVRLAKVKPGMTANVTIHTEKKNNVLVVPSRAIIKKGDSQKIVRVPTGLDQFRERKIKTGLRGDSGITEIIQGLQKGEEVITYIEEQ